MLIDIVLVCRAAHLLCKRKSEQKREKGAARTRKKKEGEAESENNKRMKERVSEGLRQGRPY